MAEAVDPGKSAPAAPPHSNPGFVTPAVARVQKELTELDLPPGCSLDFPDKNDILHFNLIVRPLDGFWKHGAYLFRWTVPQKYPFAPPKVRCVTNVLHPNIDEDGNVCLNILREDWKPICDIEAVLNGILLLFLEPSPIDPLNKYAAESLIMGPDAFQRRVLQYEAKKESTSDLSKEC